MTSLTCFPDEYLSETQLNAMFNEFELSLHAGRSNAAVFSSLVNNVRHLYMAPLLKDRSDELARLRAELSAAHEPLPRYDSATTESGVSPDTEIPAPHGVGATPEAPSTGLAVVQPEEIWWPAETFTLHIGSYSADHRRDMPAWTGMNKDGWTERMDFEVFKYEEPGTIRVDVTEQFDSHRMMVNTSKPEWKHRLTFYAYGKPRPGTRYIWVAFRADPDRCIFLKGTQADSLAGWERVLEFWVPV